MTQWELANLLGFHQAHVYRLETDQRKPNVALAIKLADLFNVSLDVLLRDERTLEREEDDDSVVTIEMKNFGAKLRALRELHGLSQRMLAEKLEFTPPYIHFLETGKTTPNVALAIKLADLFNVSLDVLLRDERTVEEVLLVTHPTTQLPRGMHHFGDKLRVLRIRNGMTLRELSEALGYGSYSHIGDVEVGRKKPSLDFVLRVSRLFGVSMDRLAKDERDLEGGEDG